MANPNFVRIPEMGSADPDELFVCPYDPIHRVAAKRFPYHLMKCRKNWGGKTMSTCPFNARHIVPQPEFRHHVANCPDKACIEQDMAYIQRKEGMDGSYMKGNTDIPTYNRKLPSPTEDWDREISADVETGYNPDDHQRPGVFRNLTGYTPAEKKAYHRKTGLFHYKTQEDVDSHVPGGAPAVPHSEQEHTQIHMPRAVRPNGALPPAAQPQSTASGFTGGGTTGPQGAAGGQQMRLPKQLPKAAGVAAAAALPNGRESLASKKSGRIAANIFGSGASYAQATSDSKAPQPVSTPLENSEMPSYKLNGDVLSNGIGHQPSSAFRPAVIGVGRGLVPGLGRGMVPGIGRGLASYSGTLKLGSEPKVGLQQQQLYQS